MCDCRIVQDLEGARDEYSRIEYCRDHAAGPALVGKVQAARAAARKCSATCPALVHLDGSPRARRSIARRFLGALRAVFP